MSGNSVRLTVAENQALTILFDAMQRVMGTEEHRLVDPEGAIVHLFDDIDAACEFVRRLTKLDLLAFLFHANGKEDAEGRRLGTYRASQEKWLEVAGSAIIVPDPPLATEERRLHLAIAAKRQRRTEIAQRREALALELKEADAALEKLDQEITDAQSVRDDLTALRTRIDALVGT